MPEGEGLIYVGLMSGTSLDGISAAVVQFSDAGNAIDHRLLGFTLVEYSAPQRDRLAAGMQGGRSEELCQLNFALGGWLADAAELAIAEARIDRASVRAVASHGQTLWHVPGGVPGHSTWQTGESAVIAERLGVDVVSDFRVRDVAAGGEGAPLVPIADALLYANPERWRLLQNIGGMGNVTVLPPAGDIAQVRAFDTGPGVAIIDLVVRALYPGLRYDDGGAIASSGVAEGSVVETLLRDPYFQQSPPKSTGREYFGG
ncbi:MAG: anhydro-N-acetylmuramic acid kinase, partial [Gemmatimonadaceae bacterium]